MSRKSLLLVDSDARSLRVLEVSLRKAGFSVNTAESAASALQWALTEPPDLVITDTNLPDFSGFELCQRLRGDNRTRHSVVVFLTEEASPETKIAGINAGADDFLTKPVLVKEIVSRVKTLLEKRRTDSIARRERPGNLSGTLANMGVVDLLQVMETGQKSGIVHISSDPIKSGGFVTDGEERGTIFFRDGEVIDAKLGRLAGVEAVYRMLLWDDGVFEIEFKSIARENTVNSSTQAILLEGMRRVDEWSRFSDLIPPVNARLTVDYAALTGAYPDVPVQMRPVLHLFDGRRSIFEVVSDAPGEDADALNVVADLHRFGILQAAHRDASESAVEAWLSSVPGVAATDPSLPSALGNAVIPSPRSASQIMGAAAPQPTPPGTELPEPLPEPSLVLSRHTVPANRPVPLTDTAEERARDPIPLTQTRGPRLRVQRVSSVVGRLPTGVPAGDGPALEFEDEDDGWEPVRTTPSPTDFPGRKPAPPVSGPAMAAPERPASTRGYVIAPAAPPPWPVADQRPPEREVRSEDPTPPPELEIGEQEEEDTEVGPTKRPAAAPPAPASAAAARPTAAGSPKPTGDFDEPATTSDWYSKTGGHEEVLWDGESNPWKARLPGLVLVAAVVAVAAFLLYGGRSEHNKPKEARERQDQVRAVKEAPTKKRAGWPKTDPKAVVIKEKAGPGTPAETPQEKERPADGAGSAKAPAEKAPAEKAPAEKAPAEKAPPVEKKEARAEKEETKPAAPKVDEAASEEALKKGESLLAGQKFRSATGFFKKAIAANPKNADAHSGLAMAYMERGRDRSAKAEAWRALKLDHGQARAHLVLALIAANESDMKGAKHSYQRYLQLAPDGKHANEVRRILKTLQ